MYICQHSRVFLESPGFSVMFLTQGDKEYEQISLICISFGTLITQHYLLKVTKYVNISPISKHKVHMYFFNTDVLLNKKRLR